MVNQASGSEGRNEVKIREQRSPNSELEERERETSLGAP